MPVDFEACVKGGGKVRTVSGPSKDHGLDAGQYVAYCYDKNGSHRGEVKKKESKNSHRPETFRGSVTDIQGIAGGVNGGNVSKIEFLKVGNWEHPLWGDIEITMSRLERFKENFESGIRKGIAIDVEHKSDEGAVGWVRALSIEGECLMAEVEWTEDGVQLIKGKKYRFFSPEYADEYTDPETGAQYRDVLIGGAITNRPFMQKLEEIVLSERTLDSKRFAGMKKKKCQECGGMYPEDEMDKHVQEKHKKKGGDKKTMAMKKEELKAKLLEDPTFVPAKEDEVDEAALKEAQEEVKKEAEEAAAKAEEEKKKKDEEEAAAAAKGEEGGSKTAKELKGKTVTMSEDQLHRLETASNEGVKAMRELREMKIKDLVTDFIYSEKNSSGVLLPRMKDAVVKFMMSLGENQRTAFSEILKALPKIKLFGEIGKDEEHGEEEVLDDPNDELHRRAKKLMSEKPDQFKTYKEAAYEVEKQMVAEGIKF